MGYNDKYGWWGPLPLVQKGQTPHAVGTQYAVGVSAKRSTHTLDLANMGGGVNLVGSPLVQKGQTPHAVGAQYAVDMQWMQ